VTIGIGFSARVFWEKIEAPVGVIQPGLLRDRSYGNGGGVEQTGWPFTDVQPPCVCTWLNKAKP
jgi:hypothetical protein